jgi:tryptophan synthase alpha subunit
MRCRSARGIDGLYESHYCSLGLKNSARSCAVAGIDGLILPDLPEHEYKLEYEAILKKYGLDFIFLVTPETSDARIRKAGCTQQRLSVCRILFVHYGKGQGF